MVSVMSELERSHQSNRLTSTGNHHVGNDEEPSAPVALRRSYQLVNVQMDFRTHNSHGSSSKVTSVTASLALGVCNVIVGKTLGSEEALLGSQPHGGSGPVGEDLPGEESGERAGGTLNDQKPSPSADTECAIHVLSDNTGQETREGTGNGSGSVVDGEALGKLVLLVPRRQVERDTWSETGFGDTEDKTDSGELLPVLDGTHASGDNTPDEAETTEVQGRPHSSEDQVEWQFENDTETVSADSRRKRKEAY